MNSKLSRQLWNFLHLRMMCSKSFVFLHKSHTLLFPSWKDISLCHIGRDSCVVLLKILSKVRLNSFYGTKAWVETWILYLFVCFETWWRCMVRIQPVHFHNNKCQDTWDIKIRYHIGDLVSNFHTSRFQNWMIVVYFSKLMFLNKSVSLSTLLNTY